MSVSAKPGGKFEVKITKALTRATAVTTLERLFMLDKKISGPIRAREARFVAKPKRRGGCIWTKYPNKVHPVLKVGVGATVPATAQYARDLNSVAEFVSIKAI